MDVTWKPVGDTGAARAKLPDSAFAFPVERKEPLTDADHVRSAIARFGEVRGVTGRAGAGVREHPGGGGVLRRERDRVELARPGRLAGASQ